MGKEILSLGQIQDLVSVNKYPVRKETEFQSRCIDGRYETSENLPPLAIAGADAGELAVIFAAANIYGFVIDSGKTFRSVLEVAGGIKNINFHTDHHGDKKITASGCGHMKQITFNPQAYSLEQSQLETIENLLSDARKKGAKETILRGEHREGAVLQIKGNYSVYPKFNFEVEVFVFHSSLSDKRHKVLARTLLKNKAVELFPGCDEEYLFEVLSETAETHLMETVKKLAPNLPIFEIIFKDNGTFKVEEMGKVI